MLEFEWNEGKRLRNLQKHGIDFLDVEFLFDSDTVTIGDDHYDYGEQRFIAFGLRGSHRDKKYNPDYFCTKGHER